MKTGVQWGLKITLLILSTGVGLVLMEAVLQWRYPYQTFQAGQEIPWMRGSQVDLSKYFTVDADMGFRPIIGQGGYSEYGTIPNDYPIEKRPGVKRLLFLGDSVTARGEILKGLQALYGNDRFEYWNAGVESFNTIQEVKFYHTYNARIQPDHVILTFHMNDFETTPVAFFNDQHQFVVYAPKTAMHKTNRWLFQHSYLYRILIGKTVDKDTGKEAIAAQIQENLQRLRDSLANANIQFHVLVLPYLQPMETWSNTLMGNRQTIFRILQELQIPYVDLWIPFEQAMKDGTIQVVIGENKTHPTPEIAQTLAQYLFEQQLL